MKRILFITIEYPKDNGSQYQLSIHKVEEEYGTPSPRKQEKKSTSGFRKDKKNETGNYQKHNFSSNKNCNKI